MDRTCVRNGIFANTAGYLAAVDQLSAWDIVERFYGGDLMCRLQNSGPSLLRREAGVSGYAMHRNLGGATAVASDDKVVVQIACFKIECSQSADCFGRHHFLSVGEHVQVFFVAGKDALDGTVAKAGSASALIA